MPSRQHKQIYNGGGIHFAASADPITRLAIPLFGHVCNGVAGVAAEANATSKDAEVLGDLRGSAEELTHTLRVPRSMTLA